MTNDNMSEMNVRLLRITTGEEVLADVVSETEDAITVQNALVVLPTAQQVGFAPWATVIDKDQPEIPVRKQFIVYNIPADPGVVDRYEEMFGVKKIIKPEEKKLIL